MYRPLRRDPDEPICTSGKKGYRTEQDAVRALWGIRELRRTNPDNASDRARVEAGCYECKSCGWWHLCSHTRPARRSDYVYKHKRSGKR